MNLYQSFIKIISNGRVSWGIAALFGLVMVLVVPSMVGAQSSSFSWTTGSDQNRGGSGTGKISCDPTVVAAVLLKKAQSDAAWAVFAREHGGYDNSREQKALAEAEARAASASDDKKSKKTASTDDAKTACSEALKASADFQKKAKDAAGGCFKGKDGVKAKESAEKEARKKVDIITCKENEEESVRCSPEAVPNFTSTSADCKKLSDNISCSYEGFACSMTCTKTCSPKKGILKYPEFPKAAAQYVGKFNKPLPLNYRVVGGGGEVLATQGATGITATGGEQWVLQRFIGGKWSDTKKSGTVTLPRPKFMDDLLGEPKEGEEGYEPDVDGDVILPPEISDDDRDDALNRLRGKASVEFVEPDIQ